MGEGAISALNGSTPVSTPTGVDLPTHPKPTQKTQDRDTISYCSPCFQEICRPIRNFFVAIWAFICCQSRKKTSETIPNDGTRNPLDRMLKNRYENIEKPHYKDLDQRFLDIPSFGRNFYASLLLELTDVEYEPKRKAVPIETIKVFIRRSKLLEVDVDSVIRRCVDRVDDYANTIRALGGRAMREFELLDARDNRWIEELHDARAASEASLRQKLQAIAGILRKERLSAGENPWIDECLELCDTEACAKDKNYAALREKLRGLEKALAYKNLSH